MKISLTFIAALLSFSSLFAQTTELRHFEISASAFFWTPTSSHLMSTNSVTQYAYPDGSYISTGGVIGYGPSIAPAANIKYYFNNKIGISLGFYMLHMDNELFVQTTDTTFSSYENSALIANFTLGISGKLVESKSIQLFYEAGIDFVPSYDFEMSYANESINPSDMDAYGVALGVYAKTGANFRITKSLSFRTALMYSFIPVEPEYTNYEVTAKTHLKTNIGGVGLETGLSINF